ncbi:hypothetical protein FJY93_02450 [Candidatus Kaiserbacteria bacterium]|nr:hypothetical protein [Candidatus Kaiserbacteria bacterium]
MAKDYFQDIVPPSSARKLHPATSRGKASKRVKEEDTTALEEESSAPTRTSRSVHRQDYEGDDSDVPIHNAFADAEDVEEEDAHEAVGLRGIRNISIPNRGRTRPAADARPTSPPFIGIGAPKQNHSKGGRLWIWVVAAVCVLILGLFAILAMRPTVVTVTPRSHAIVFDPSTAFVAYPADIAATGTLPYKLVTIDLDDTEVIPALGGTTRVETKASASITVFNDFSTSPVRLVATTRFETPSGLIFRTPNDIVVPGKKGSSLGKVTVTVIAENAGEQYNTSSVVRFTVPGLKTNAPMYKGVYADSTGPITGGFAGDRVSTDPGARATAIATMRERLQQTALEKLREMGGEGSMIFPSLMQIAYQDLPDTNEANGVGIHQRIRIIAPSLPAQVLAQMIGSSVAADTENADLKIVGGEGYTALSSDYASSTAANQPFHFTLGGTATLVWDVDTEALLEALIGRDQTSFQSIVATFPGIESAVARVEPFWKKTFPKDRQDIQVRIIDPSAETSR